MQVRYPFKEIEEKWRNYWEEKKIYKVDLRNPKRKLYCLVMFLYPSADKLHIGHWYNYGPTDTWARLKRMQGWDVFEPIGYDAFGLPAENYAIKTGIHPQDSTQQNINVIRQQLKQIGAMYDWDYEIDTSKPEYYKWTQWVFLQLYKMGLAYKAPGPVNWCPSCNTVLANEQVIDGSCERCGTPVVRRFLTQWFFRITKYAEELLNDLDKLDWPEKTKIMQRNWIGKSVGAEIDFEVADTGDKFTVFTTRPDTIYGATYVVLAPEHPLVDKITKPEYKEQVQAYLDFVAHETEIERTSTEKEKTGVFTGSYAINPATKEKIPIWIADYVLIHYGTGAVMGVPAHDERDFEFAKKFGLPIRKVILQPGTKPEDELESAYVEPGIMINSGKYNGISSEEAWDKIVDDLASEGVARRSVKYRLRDWLISRQRYWGAPIPIVYCEKCGEVPVPEEQLPVLLPHNVDFKPTGESPLARCEEFINTTCPKCGAPAKRDPDTMDTFVDSSWYYLRYLSPHLDSAPFDKELVKIWCPVDKYVGGAEHATMHLLYARFITKALRDAGYLEFDEPFISLYHQGTITNKGAKMSKSKGNVVNPDDFVSKYGSDVFRLYLMFMGRYDEGGDWSDEGINGMWRFVNRVYNFVLENKDVLRSFKPKDKYEVDELGDYARAIYRKTHKTIKKVTADIDTFNFNTAIASLMELFNLLSEFDANLYDDFTKEVFVHCVKRFIIMLGPLAPHLAEELWEISGENESLFVGSKWVEPDEKALVEEEVTIVAQVNGKVRARIKVPIDLDDETLKNIVLNDASVQKYVGGKKISKIVVVKNKLVSIACEDN